MPGDDDEIIIRNGTFWNWLSYEVVFGGTTVEVGDDEYAIEGGLRVKGYWVLAAFVAGAFLFGLAF